MDGDVARSARASVCFAVILHIITLPDAQAVGQIPRIPFLGTRQIDVRSVIA